MLRNAGKLCEPSGQTEHLSREKYLPTVQNRRSEWREVYDHIPPVSHARAQDQVIAHIGRGIEGSLRWGVETDGTPYIK